MALVVENGTGLADAEAYLSVAQFRTFCTNYGYDVGTATDTDLEVKLRLGAEFVDCEFRYKGQRLVPAQGREFPRTGLTDWSGYDVTGVPARVVKANAELAFKALSGPLYEDLDRGGQVVSESVGPMSTTYAAGAPVGTVRIFAEKLLAQYVRHDGDTINGPFFQTSDAPLFGVGMHSNPAVEAD